MIFDCFTYFEEADLLQLRLKELSDVVDYFVLVEGVQTYRGEEKPSYFGAIEWKDAFKSYRNRIFSYQTFFPLDMTDPWEREAYQRNSIRDALKWRAKPDDTILVSDADEIPRPSSIQSLDLQDEPIYFDVDQYYWNYNWRVPAHCNQGGRPFAVKFEHLGSPQEIRASHSGIHLPNAGWHFSYSGGYEKVKKKIESFAHSEYDKDEFKEYHHMVHCMTEGLDPFERFPLKWYDIEEATHPRALLPPD